MATGGLGAFRNGCVVGVLVGGRGRPAVAAGNDAQEAVGRAGGVDMDCEGGGRPDIELRAALPVRMPADAFVA